MSTCKAVVLERCEKMVMITKCNWSLKRSALKYQEEVNGILGVEKNGIIDPISPGHLVFWGYQCLIQKKVSCFKTLELAFIKVPPQT